MNTDQSVHQRLEDDALEGHNAATVNNLSLEQRHAIASEIITRLHKERDGDLDSGLYRAEAVAREWASKR